MKWSKQALIAMPIISAALLAMTAPTLAAGLPVYAQVSEDQAAEENTVMEKIPEDDPVFQKQEDTGDTSMDPLTPDGNLTLVDDEGPHEETGKQFITVTSKSGNYFYIIIDRDDEGENTVHFLNLVDEADLMALLDEETKDQMNANDEIRAAEEARLKAEKEAAEAREAARAAKQEAETDTAEKPSPLPAILTIAALAAGGGGYYYYTRKKNEEERKNRPDSDDDEYWLDDDDEDHSDEDPDNDELERDGGQTTEEGRNSVDKSSEDEAGEDEEYEEDGRDGEDPDNNNIEEWN